MNLGPILRAMGRNKARFGLIALEIALTLAIVTNCVAMISDARTQMSRPSGFDDDNLISVNAIPFDRVWTAALALCGGGLPRWSLVSADDQQGVIRARALTRVLRRQNDVRVTIGLDQNGQTRVDVAGIAFNRSRDLGSNARGIDRFLRELDAKVGAAPGQILDATRQPTFTL